MFEILGLYCEMRDEVQEFRIDLFSQKTRKKSEIENQNSSHIPRWHICFLLYSLASYNSTYISPGPSKTLFFPRVLFMTHLASVKHLLINITKLLNSTTRTAIPTVMWLSWLRHQSKRSSPTSSNRLVLIWTLYVQGKMTDSGITEGRVLHKGAWIAVLLGTFLGWSQGLWIIPYISTYNIMCTMALKQKWSSRLNKR